MTIYATLDEAKLELATTQATTATPSIDDRRLLGKIRAVSRRVDLLRPSREHWPIFAPTIGTHLEAITAFKTRAADNTLDLSLFLLALTGSVSVNGATINNVAAYPDPAFPPFNRLRITDNAQSWYSFCQSPSTYAPPQASIAGVWGFHTDYANAWMAVDALAAAITTTTATTFTVSDVDGVDLNGVAPRFSIGNLIKIDDEYMEVGLTNPTTNVVTVVRGVNGSTAATHLITAPVSTWQVEAPVKTAVARQAAFQYARRGAFVSVEVQGLTEVRFPNDWLQEVYGALAGYDL